MSVWFKRKKEHPPIDLAYIRKLEIETGILTQGDFKGMEVENRGNTCPRCLMADSWCSGNYCVHCGFNHRKYKYEDGSTVSTF